MKTPYFIGIATFLLLVTISSALATIYNPGTVITVPANTYAQCYFYTGPVALRIASATEFNERIEPGEKTNTELGVLFDQKVRSFIIEYVLMAEAEKARRSLTTQTTTVN